MHTTVEKVYNEAVNLPPRERAQLVDKIISSFNYPAQNKVDELWAMEAEERIDAYEQGQIGSTPAEKVFEEIDRLTSRRVSPQFKLLRLLQLI